MINLGYLKNSNGDLEIVAVDEFGNPLPDETPQVENKTNTPPEPVPSTSDADINLYDDKTDSQTYKAKKASTTTTNAATEEVVANGVNRPWSFFNTFSLYNFAGSAFNPDTTGDSYDKIDFGSPDIYATPTVAKIIEKTGSLNKNQSYQYDWSDFALCKYLGKIPNNYMITVRRFPYPVPDDIISPEIKNIEGTKVELSQPDIARAITWMSEATGNKLDEILKFDFNYNWKDNVAEVQTIHTDTQAKRGKFGQFVDNSYFLSAANKAANGYDATAARLKEQRGSNFDPLNETYPNHVFGPYNSIRKVVSRDGGLEFNQTFTLTFEYEVRAIGNANPKALMLDQFANIMALTYSNAPFWGGETRYLGSSGAGSIGSPLGNASLIKSGDYLGFLQSVGNDLMSMGKNFVNDVSKGFAGSKFVNNILGGALLDLFNSPQASEIAKALLTGDATGNWHVTIGNPLNPIAMMGNLVLEKTEVNFKGPLGPLDFPDTLEVKLTLKPGRPRDKGEIESMFNAGRGRFYLTPKDEVDINKDLIKAARKGEPGGTTPADFKKFSRAYMKAKKTKLDLHQEGYDEIKKLANG
jgi:hypothetical protein